VGLQNIKNIIFDLGGVIIDLDLQAAFEAFASLSNLSVTEIVQKTNGLMLFTEYEQGMVSSQQFRQQIADLLQISVSEETIDDAWCAMLGGIPVQRLDLLRSLRSTYRTFALSNTNDIHVRRFNNIVENATGSANILDEYFEKVYFSHEMKMRKPDTVIYQTVLDQQSLVPAETLFIDDNLDNISGAGSIGIQTLHLTHPEQLTTFFNGVR
jgi:putative hydrolase of the HAD superfamily